MRKLFSVAGLVISAGLLVGFAAEPPVPPVRVVPAVPVQVRGATTVPASDLSALVSVTPGDWPLLITSPHGGRVVIEGVPQRTGSGVATKRGSKANFTFAWDKNSDLLAVALADEIQRRTGHRPYLVVAHFTRRQIDANRPVEDGVESEAAKPVYEAYHSAVAKYRAEILGKWNRGLLVDVHGHGGDPVSLIRGTANRMTVQHLLEEFGEAAFTGPEGLMGPIEAAGVKVVPRNDAVQAKENPALNGGYTVRHYGSFAGGNFDAIQFETGNASRAVNEIPHFAGQLADGLVPFVEMYVLNPEKGAAATQRSGASTQPGAK